MDWSHAGSAAMAASSSWTQCGSTYPAGTTAATINSALVSCPQNSYISLAAGTFNLSTGLLWQNISNKKIVGQGADQTFLVFTGHQNCSGTPTATVCMMSGDTNYSGSPSNLANWTAGYSQGATSITLSSVPSLTVGDPITLDQLDDTSDSGDVYICSAAGTCASNGDGGSPRSGRGQQQIVTVTSITGSGPYTVGIDPGLAMPNWSSSKSPQAWWASSPIFNDGIENVSINASGAGSNEDVTFFNCSGCWVKGIRSIGPTGRSHVVAWQSNHITIESSYFYKTNDAASVNYGFETFPASDCLVENNIFQQIQAPYPTDGTATGCVFSYNYDVDNVFTGGTWQQQSGFPHAVGDDHILYEGNQGAGIYSDNFHGTHNFQTMFRNTYDGYQPNEGKPTTGGLGALLFNSYSRFYNVVGNVLGSSVFTHYKNTTATGYTASTSVISLGIGDGVPNDTNVARTVMLWGNYDTVTAAVRWCGNSSDPGWGTTCGSASEVPSTIPNYANPVPSTTTLPPSFYLAAKPSWWPSSKPWPAIGPDVTGGNLSGFAGHAYSIPAADCYSSVMGGTATGTGNVLSFNAANCYGSGSGTSTGTPGAPSNLVGTVVTH